MVQHGIALQKVRPVHLLERQTRDIMLRCMHDSLIAFNAPSRFSSGKSAHRRISLGQHLAVHGAGVSVPIANEIQVISLASLMGLL